MKFIVHDSPVRRGDSNYIARVDLSAFGLPGEVEQLWLQRREDGLIKICCIPFRAYGLSLADTVSLSADGTSVIGVVSKSGRRVLRVLLMPVVNAVTVMNEIIGEVSRLGLLSELSGDRHVAIDVPAGVDVPSLIDIAEREESASRAYWEWADSVPFSAAGSNS
ncbi:DUF4265 domain-containing protein [Streptomyces hokutonensis]|uniref:DUF4265 domain-containing protein n=1 Tax=Streptomyces hokutonensis TaxID=1306990 RepID=UPI0033FA1A81